MKVVDLFNSIRDLPLRFPEKMDDEDLRCWGKHRKLYKLLTENGFKVRYLVCDFLWSKQKIPPNLLAIPHMDKDKHLFLEIRLNNKSIMLDCSNDSKLPDYNKWDGKSNCKIAVNYTRIHSPQDSAVLEAEELSYHENLLRRNYEFYKSMNRFFDALRKNKSA